MIALISALISAGAAILVCVINNIAQAKRHEAVIEVEIKELKEDISRLEKKMELHNNAVFRLTTLEEKASSHSRRLQVLEDEQRKEYDRLTKLP